MANTISVSVLGDVKDISRKLGNVEGQLSGFGKKMSGLGKMIGGAVLAAGAVDLFKDIVGSASDAQQSLGATETVFGKFANTVTKTSDQAATKYGLSANQYRENANLIGSLFKNQGVATDKLAGQTETMIGKASDLAATFGGDTKTAVESLGAAYKGEFDSLEKYGISLKQSTVNAEAMRVANVKTAKDWDKLTVAQQRSATQQATTNLINKQSKDSMGAFSRETDTLAHQQQVLAAKVENVKTKLGTALLPILTNVAAFVSDTVLPAMERFGNWFANDVMPKIQPFIDFLKNTVIAAFETVKGWIDGNSAGMTSGFTGVWTTIVATVGPILTNLVSVFQTGFEAIKVGVAFAVNFILGVWNNLKGTLIPLISGIWNGVVNIIQGVLNIIKGIFNVFIGIFTGNWSKAWQGIKQIFGGVWQAIKGVFQVAWNGIKLALSVGLAFIKQIWSTAWNAIKAFLGSIWSGIKSVISAAINAVKSFISGGLNGIKSAWSAAWNAVKTVVSTIWNGIKTAVSTAIGNVVKTVSGLKGKVLGALSGAGSWLVSVGRNIIQGLINGIGNMAGWLKDKIGSVINGAVDWAKSLLGIASPSKVFKEIGKWTGEGLVSGIDAMGQKIRSAAGGMTAQVVTGFGEPKLALAGTASGSGSYGGGNNYYLTVNALDPSTAGRVVVDAIKDHERLNGSGWRS